MKPRENEILTASQVAQYFGVGTRTVTRWRREGKLRPFRTPGGHTRYYGRDILPYLEARENDNES